MGALQGIGKNFMKDTARLEGIEAYTFYIRLYALKGLYFAIKFCLEHGIKYGFFVEKALKEQLEREELKEDILDLKTLRDQEKNAIPFEEYLKMRHV